MVSTQESYQAVLEDLERQRAELDTAITAIRRVMGMPATANATAPGGRPAVAGSLRSDEFFNMSIINAAKRYLTVVKQPTTAPDIAKALREHGLINDSPGFVNTVYSVLFREYKKDGSVVQSTGKRWGLGEWYPNRKPKVAKAATDATGDAGSDDAAIIEPDVVDEEPTFEQDEVDPPIEFRQPA